MLGGVGSLNHLSNYIFQNQQSAGSALLNSKTSTAGLSSGQSGTDSLSISRQALNMNQSMGVFSALDTACEVSELNSSEKSRAEALQARIDEIYGIDHSKKLSADEKKIEDSLNKQIDELLWDGKKRDLTEAEERKAAALESEIDALHDEEVLTASQEKKLGIMEEELQKLYGFKPRELSASEEEELDSLYKKLDELFGYAPEKELTDKEVAELEELETSLNKILGHDNPSGMTEMQQKKAADLNSKIERFEAVSKMRELKPEEANVLEDMYSELDDLVSTNESQSARRENGIRSWFSIHTDELFGV